MRIDSIEEQRTKVLNNEDRGLRAETRLPGLGVWGADMRKHWLHAEEDVDNDSQDKREGCEERERSKNCNRTDEEIEHKEDNR